VRVGIAHERRTVARRRWAAYKAAGHVLSYFQQNDKGAWEEKASA